MTAKQLFEELHPGRTILEDVLKPLGMGINALAKELHIPATRLNDIVRGRRGITADTAEVFLVEVVRESTGARQQLAIYAGCAPGCTRPRIYEMFPISCV